MGYRSYTFTETRRWTNTPMRILVTLLHPGLASDYTRTRTSSETYSHLKTHYIPRVLGHPSDLNTSRTSSCTHTLSLLFSYLQYDIPSFTYILRYPVITDYLRYPLPIPYGTFTWRATHNTLHGDLISASIATDISAHFGHLLRVRARYLSYILCRR